MAVITNLNTTQSPMSAVGLTGKQVLKFITAPRVYVKASDSTPTPVTVKSNGTTPSGWTDLGIVDTNFKITYDKKLKEIRTGLDQILQAVYVEQRTANFEFDLSQFDDVVMAQLTGLTASMVTSGSVYQFGIGSEDVVQKALLLVAQNKLDGKEWQFYSPNAYVSFSLVTSGQETVVRGSGNLPLFTWGSTQSLMVQSIFA